MEKMDYHRAFMRTQHIATDFAKKFNEALAQVQGLFDSSTQNYLSMSTMYYVPTRYVST